MIAARLLAAAALLAGCGPLPVPDLDPFLEDPDQPGPPCLPEGTCTIDSAAAGGIRCFDGFEPRGEPGELRCLCFQAEWDDPPWWRTSDPRWCGMFFDVHCGAGGPTDVACDDADEAGDEIERTCEWDCLAYRNAPSDVLVRFTRADTGSCWDFALLESVPNEESCR